MPGGLMQLMLKSASDNYFIGNPQISFYKVVYRRYSNFSIESIDISEGIMTAQGSIPCGSIPILIDNDEAAAE